MSYTAQDLQRFIDEPAKRPGRTEFARDRARLGRAPRLGDGADGGRPPVGPSGEVATDRGSNDAGNALQRLPERRHAPGGTVDLSGLYHQATHYGAGKDRPSVNLRARFQRSVRTSRTQSPSPGVR